MKFTINGELPDMNQIIKASKSHFMAYSSMKKKYTELVQWSSKGLQTVNRADFTITWYCKDRRKDKDNVSGGGTKFIFDGLVENGIIKNDGWNEIGNVTHVFEVDKNNPRIVVEIHEVEG